MSDAHGRQDGGFGRRLRRALPLGIGWRKPRHYRDMMRVVWENRDNLGHAWRVLSRGVCDGCALGVSGFHDWTIDGVHLCQTRLNMLRLNTMGAMDPAQLSDAGRLAGMSNRELMRLGRLAEPMVRERGDAGFRVIGWDEAIERVASRVRAVDPSRIAFFLTSRGLTNEVYYVAQKVARLLGTNNIDNAARLCHSPSTAAMKKSIGAAASTCSYRDWIGSDLIVFFGSNAANDQPVTTKYLREAKRRGSRVVLVNPYEEPGMRRYWIPSVARSAVFGTELADDWFAVSTGGDIAFLYGVVRVMIDRGWVDGAFIERHTSGFEALRERAGAMRWEELEAAAGVSRGEMERFAVMMRDAGSAVFVWSMGITQHAGGTETVGMIVNLALLKGMVGRERCGLMPIRGHSGVQGGAEMGAYATAFPGGRPIDKSNAAELSRAYGFEVPAEPGLQTVDMLAAAERGGLDVLYCVGGNFLRTMPDPGRVARAMGNVGLRVHQDLILTDQMLIEPAGDDDAVLLLPAQTRYEQEGGGTETTTERRVLFSPQIPRAVGGARCEWRILRDLAAAVKGPDAMPAFGCDSGEAIREEIARVIPFYDGIQDLKKAGDQFQWGGPRLCEGWVFVTDDGRAHFSAPDLPVGAAGSGGGERGGAAVFRLSTRRGRQFNSMVYRDVDPLTGAARDAVLMNGRDAARLGVGEGDRVEVRSEHGAMAGRVRIAPIAPGNVQAHWPEANVLIGGDRRDVPGGVPDYNAAVTISRA